MTNVFYTNAHRNLDWLKSKNAGSQVNTLRAKKRNLSTGTKTTDPHWGLKCYWSCKMTNTAEWGTFKIPKSLRICRQSWMLNFQPHSCNWCPFFHLSPCQCTILLKLFKKETIGPRCPFQFSFILQNVRFWLAGCKRFAQINSVKKLYNMEQIFRRFYS